MATKGGRRKEKQHTSTIDCPAPAASCVELLLKRTSPRTASSDLFTTVDVTGSLDVGSDITSFHLIKDRTMSFEHVFNFFNLRVRNHNAFYQKTKCLLGFSLCFLFLLLPFVHEEEEEDGHPQLFQWRSIIR